MKGDFTRDTFDSRKHFSRVLMQQGRVTLDADHNEQVAILLHYVRTLARDLIGHHAAPVEHRGFTLSVIDGGLQISRGRYYVDGILVENGAECPYIDQPDLLPEDDLAKIGNNDGGDSIFWLYLDVWERHITQIEDDTIREPALRNPGTCTRAKVVWQVKAMPIRETLNAKLAELNELIETQPELQAQIDAINAELGTLDVLVEDAPLDPTTCDMPLTLLVAGQSEMSARVDPGHKTEDPCVMPPDSKYRGAENQLYRVEIHQGGAVGKATFKWSRDNGSVATAWLGNEGNNLNVVSSRGFSAGDWIELSDERLDRQGEPGLLVKLAKVEGGILSVDPGTVPKDKSISFTDYAGNPKARRWDQVQTDDSGAMPVIEAPATPWIDLEDGVQIQFSPNGTYQTGDYWLIPARVSTGKIEWPVDEATPPQAQPRGPHGIKHHYAPLGFVLWVDGAMATRICECTFGPQSTCGLTTIDDEGEDNMLKPTKAAPLGKPKVGSPAKAKKPKKPVK